MRAASKAVIRSLIATLLVAGCGKTTRTEISGNAVTDSGDQPGAPGPSLSYAAPHLPFGALNIALGCTTASGCSDGDPNNFGDPANTTAYYPSALYFYENVAVALTPTNVGEPITSCEVSPTLPSGLTLSAKDCSISGTPTTTSTLGAYRVSATGASGTVHTLVQMMVQPSAKKMINLPRQTYVLVKGQAITPIAPQFGGGASSADCVKNGGLPSGLSFSPGTCTITGTPTAEGTSEYVFAASSGTTVHANWSVPPAPGYWSPLGTSVLLLFYVVDPAVRPHIDLDGESFGRMELRTGQAMIPITPTSSGASITSCSAIPNLPDGLSLSQSDCTLSGTPTAASPPATYLITPKHGTQSGNAISLDLSVTSSPKQLSCQSDTLCVHSRMPLWSQSDPGLAAYLSAQGYSVGNPPTDQGWCGGVSAAMVLKTYFQEIGLYSSPQSTAWPSPFLSSDGEYPFILKAMQLVATNIPAGGTSFPNTGMSTLLHFCGTLFENFAGGSPSIYTSPAQYSHGMPMAWLSVHGPNGSAPHALVINGVDGNYFKVYDPWGAVYNATIGYDSNGQNGTISFVSGTSFNEINFYDSGVASAWIEWIKDYVAVSGSGPTYRCQ